MAQSAPPTDVRPPVVGPLLTLAAPMLLGQAGQVLIQLTDTAMIGHLGRLPLAGAALAGTFVMLALYFAYGVLGAVAPRVAQAFGAGDGRGVAAAARAGTALAALVGVAMALTLSVAVPLLPRLGQPPDVVAVAGGYLLLVAWSLPAAMVAVALGQAAEAVNRPWPVLAAMVAAVAANALLDWLLIFGHLGCPRLGLAGAGFATLAARVLQAAALAVWIARHPDLRRWWSGAGSERGMLRELLAQGLPVAVQDVLEGGSFAVGSLLVGWAGTTALAANQVTIGIASLAWMVPISLSLATSMRVAHAAGAGDMPTVRRTGIAALALGVALMAACAAIYTTCGLSLARIFSADEAVVTLAGTLITIAGIYQISDLVQSVSLGALRGLLDNRVPMIANAVCYWGLSLPTVYLLTVVAGWGALGVWVGYLPWMALTGLFFMNRFLRLSARR